MLAESRPGPAPPACFVLDHHRMLDMALPRSPRSPRLGLKTPLSLGLVAAGATGTTGSTGSRPSTLASASRPTPRPVFDFVRTAAGRPLSLPYSVQPRPSPPPSLLDSLSLTEDPDHGDQDNSPAPSLLDSPRLTPVSSLMDSNSLARMARLRQPALLDSYQALPAIKRGVLWQQRERLWSRWKERYFILTSDYLHCFKRRAAGDGLSQMGHFIFKIRLVELDAVEWLNRRSYSVVALSTRDRPRVLLRASHGLEDWFELLEECTIASKQRRRALYERQPAQFDWNGSLQREGEGSLSMSPGVEALLRRRLEEQEKQQDRKLEVLQEKQKERLQEQQEHDQERQQDRHQERQLDRQHERQQDRQLDRQLDRQHERQQDRQQDRQHERQQDRQQERQERPSERQLEWQQERKREEYWIKPQHFQRKHQMLTELDEQSPPPSAPSTFRSAPRAGPPPLAAPPPPPGPPASPYAYQPAPSPAPPPPRQPVYHRLNHDVFFMAAGQNPLPDNGGRPSARVMPGVGAQGARQGLRGPAPLLAPAGPAGTAATSRESCASYAHLAAAAAYSLGPLEVLVRRELSRQGRVEYGWC